MQENRRVELKIIVSMQEAQKDQILRCVCVFVLIHRNLFGAVVGGNDVGGTLVEDENVKLRYARPHDVASPIWSLSQKPRGISYFSCI